MYDTAMAFTHIGLGAGLLLNIIQVWLSGKKAAKRHIEQMEKQTYQHDMMWNDYKLRYNISNGDHD